MVGKWRTDSMLTVEEQDFWNILSRPPNWREFPIIATVTDFNRMVTMFFYQAPDGKLYCDYKTIES